MTLQQIFEEWMEISSKMFPDSTPESCILHAIEECCESSKEKDNRLAAVEVADAMFCLLSFCGKRGISMPTLFSALSYKLEKNKSRTWHKNADNTYSHD